MAAVDVRDYYALTRAQARDLGGSLRDAVNAAALAVTDDARNRLKRKLGATRELRGYRNTSGRKGSTKSRRVNAWFKEATVDTNPTAIVLARGPAALIEHDIKAHWVQPRGSRRSVSTASAVQLLADDVTGARRTAREHAAAGKRPAVGPGGSYFHGFAKRPGEGKADTRSRGFIANVHLNRYRRPQGGPISAAFRAAPQTISAAAGKDLWDGVKRDLQRARPHP